MLLDLVRIIPMALFAVMIMVSIGTIPEKMWRCL